MQYPKIVGLVTLSSLRREIVMLDFDVDMHPPGISIPLGGPGPGRKSSLLGGELPKGSNGVVT